MEEVNYSANYPVGDFLFRTWGMKLHVGLNESYEDAWNKAEALCWSRYEKQYPEWAKWFKENQQFPTPDIPILKTYPAYSIPKESSEMEVVNTESPNQINKEPTLEEQINSCTEIKILESYKFIVKNKPELEKIYQNKMKELKRRNPV